MKTHEKVSVLTVALVAGLFGLAVVMALAGCPWWQWSPVSGLAGFLLWDVI